MLRTQLADASREESRRLRHQPRLASRVCDCVEIVLLSAAG
jgi:hypothetical protein